MTITTKQGNIIKGDAIKRESGYLFEHAMIDGKAKLNVFVPFTIIDEVA